MSPPEAANSDRDVSRGAVHLIYHGRLGNNLFQYCFARVLAEELQCDLVAHMLLGFEQATSRHLGSEYLLYEHEIVLRQERADAKIRVQENDCVSRLGFDEIIPYLQSRQGRKRITIEYGCFLHIPFYNEYLDRIKHRWLVIPDRFSMHENDLTIHIRSGDIWEENTLNGPHDSYCALPFSFYDSIVRQRLWRRIHVVTEDRNDPMASKLCRCYGASLVSGTAFEDFNFIKSSKNIVLSVSTFSWFAAFLSTATTVYYPLGGLFHPGIRQDIDLHVNEPRYCYRCIYPDDQFRQSFSGVYFAGNPAWTGTPQLRQFLLLH